MNSYRGYFKNCRQLLDPFRSKLAMRRTVRLWRNEDGGALVEFSFLLPMFALLFFGVIQWGSIFWVQNGMVNAAREAARSMAVQGLTINQARTIAANCVMQDGTGVRCPPSSPVSETPPTATYNGSAYNISAVDHCTDTPKEQDVTVTISLSAAGASLFGYKIGTGNLTTSVTMRKELACP